MFDYLPICDTEQSSPKETNTQMSIYENLLQVSHNNLFNVLQK